MSGQQLLPEEPTSPVIPSSRTNFASLKARVENVERKMGELRETWMKDIQEHLGKDANMEPMKLEGTLNIQEFDSMELFHDAQKRALDGAARTHFQNTLLRVSDIQDTF